MILEQATLGTIDARRHQGVVEASSKEKAASILGGILKPFGLGEKLVFSKCQLLTDKENWKEFDTDSENTVAFKRRTEHNSRLTVLFFKKEDSNMNIFRLIPAGRPITPPFFSSQELSCLFEEVKKSPFGRFFDRIKKYVEYSIANWNSNFRNSCYHISCKEKQVGFCFWVTFSTFLVCNVVY